MAVGRPSRRLTDEGWRPAWVPAGCGVVTVGSEREYGASVCVCLDTIPGTRGCAIAVLELHHVRVRRHVDAGLALPAAPETMCKGRLGSKSWDLFDRERIPHGLSSLARSSAGRGGGGWTGRRERRGWPCWVAPHHWAVRRRHAQPLAHHIPQHARPSLFFHPPDVILKLIALVALLRIQQEICCCDMIVFS